MQESPNELFRRGKFAAVLAWFGEKENALAEPTRATVLKMSPVWDSLRDNPRFLDLLKNMVAKRAFFAAAFLFAFAFTARGEWQIADSKVETARAGVEHRHLSLRDPVSGAEEVVELAQFSYRNATLRVIDDASRSSDLAATMQRVGAIAGVNGGYFDPNDAPVGLLISDGREIASLSRAKLLSGVFSVLNGRVRIQRSTEFSKKSKPTQARQCGPFLVDRGQAIAGLNDTRAARRTFVATGANEFAAIGYSSSVTLAQLAALLATPELKLQRALNLDGGSSSAFWCAGASGVISIPERKTVRDYLAIVPK